MSALCWTEKQRKLKQHARETAARRRKWEKIAADQEAEEETKFKKALEQRKRELESKNRYLRQPLAKPPPAKRTFLTKEARRAPDSWTEGTTASRARARVAAGRTAEERECSLLPRCGRQPRKGEPESFHQGEEGGAERRESSRRRRLPRRPAPKGTVEESQKGSGSRVRQHPQQIHIFWCGGPAAMPRGATGNEPKTPRSLCNAKRERRPQPRFWQWLPSHHRI